MRVTKPRGINKNYIFASNAAGNGENVLGNLTGSKTMPNFETPSCHRVDKGCLSGASLPKDCDDDWFSLVFNGSIIFILGAIGKKIELYTGLCCSGDRSATSLCKATLPEWRGIFRTVLRYGLAREAEQRLNDFAKEAGEILGGFERDAGVMLDDFAREEVMDVYADFAREEVEILNGFVMDEMAILYDFAREEVEVYDGFAKEGGVEVGDFVKAGVVEEDDDFAI
ncbi:hypothetical protein VE01_03916 [Pseudogymnoascus verrucosus]|uniref:Uncharacterized protein n=1 Tax=Pseudogymnoascus verrucosus TaxID=342668 RepID=A0A1B8GPW3_9PEZI|nr:uncharacterized protein VE01_03916 [Pseudogymnoascus verrucosus]OBT97879.1 hypothetical protein VE01_03916 [Pseudogymnoascus verrucosus]